MRESGEACNPSGIVRPQEKLGCEGVDLLSRNVNMPIYLCMGKYFFLCNACLGLAMLHNVVSPIAFKLNNHGIYKNFCMRHASKHK